MIYPVSPYIEERCGSLYATGTGVSLDSIITRFQSGASPEKIVHSFPTLKLSAVDGVIAYYLENEKTIGEYLAEGERETEQSAVPLSQSNSKLFERLESARQIIAKQL
jgi:uncharacterized protein (DUF433 family)